MQGQVHSLNSVLLFCKCRSSSITWIFSLMNPLFYSDAFCNRKVYNTLWWSKKCLKRVSNSIMKSSSAIFKYPIFETSWVKKWLKVVIDNNIDKEFRNKHIDCSKQFKWNLYFCVSGHSRPFWAVLKLL